MRGLSGGGKTRHKRKLNKNLTMSKCVLVTGGAGYIGSHTTVELTAAGYDVVIADNLSNSDISGVEGVRAITGKNIPFVELNCLDKAAMEDRKSVV